MAGRRFNTIVTAVVCGLCLLPGRAQTAPAGATEPPTTVTEKNTIHIYVNRMQIPVLLLDPYRHPTRPVPASRFQVHLEGTPPFAPSDVRLEGDDPISLAVLLDNSDPEEFLWDRLGRASRDLARSLRPQDRVEVYGMDGCHLRRFGSVEMPSQEHLQKELEDAAATKPYAAVRKQQGPCAGPVSLWDAMLYLGGVLRDRPGRRILLALSNGQRASSTAEMENLRHVLNAYSITAFAVRHGEVGMDSVLLQVDQGRAVKGGGHASEGPAPLNMPGDNTWGGYPLAIEAELSGGMVMSATLYSLPRTLAEVIDRVRGRYIVEFPRPPDLTVGTRAITISIGKTHDFIRPAGISVPVASPEEKVRPVTAAETFQTPIVPSTASAMPAPAPAEVVRRPPVDPPDITDDAEPAKTAQPRH